MVDLSHDLCQWLHFFFLKGIHIAWDIEVVVILDDLLKASQMGKLIHVLSALIGLEDLLDMSIRHDVLVLALVKFLGSIDKVNVPIGAVLLENDDRRWDAGIEEDIGRKTDHGINGPFFQQGLANGSFSIAAEKDPVRKDDSHDTLILLEVVITMQEKGEVRLRLRCELAKWGEARIMEEAGACRPLS